MSFSSQLTIVALVIAAALAAFLAVYGSEYWPLMATTLAGTTNSADGAVSRNHLGGEASPYLQQHAGNPVNWYPWGEEAFAEAKALDRPIFLSIGYSTCHWCHVMEEESFENEEVARFLNEHFISVKVDREERPDIDNVYMTAVQIMGGRGGWPLTVVITPDKEPFFGGTYFPPTARGGLPGLMDVLTGIERAWRTDRSNILSVAKQLMDATSKHAISVASGETVLDSSTVDTAFRTLQNQFDERWGGFGNAPKFPSPPTMAFLLRHWYRTKEPKALEMVEKTLTLMAQGGLHDHLEGGFHRYSIDRYWRVPHFEKMLYDNAQLSELYLETFQVTGDQFYSQIATKTLEYVLAGMTGPGGGFYTATDADSEGEEGTFFVWRPEEIKKILGDDDGELLCLYYHVDDIGSFEGGSSVLYVAMTEEQFAQSMDRTVDDVGETLNRGRAALLAARRLREPPLRDEKRLASWNALMISAFAKGYSVLHDERYREAATNAGRFVKGRMWKDKALYRRWMDDGLSGPGFLDDYALMASAAIDLYEITFDANWLLWATELASQMGKRFWDQENGGYFFTDQADVPIRPKEIYDGVMPSGNAAASEVLLKLGEITGDTMWRADSVFAAFADQIASYPPGHAQMLSNLELMLAGLFEIVLAGEPNSEGFAELVEGLGEPFVPHKVVALAGDPKVEAISPMTAGRPMLGGLPTAYVCRNYACQLPVTEVKEMYSQLGLQPQRSVGEPEPSGR